MQMIRLLFQRHAYIYGSYSLISDMSDDSCCDECRTKRAFVRWSAFLCNFEVLYTKSIDIFREEKLAG